jgi:leucyl aminopeptidase
LAQLEADALIVPVFEGAREERFGIAGELIESGEVTGKSLELTLIHHPQGVSAKRVLLAGAGKAEKFDAPELRRLAGAAVRFLKTKSVKKIVLALDSSLAKAGNVSAAVEGAILGSISSRTGTRPMTTRSPWNRSP